MNNTNIELIKEHLRNFYSRSRIEKNPGLILNMNNYISRAYKIVGSDALDPEIQKMVSERIEWGEGK